MLWRTPKNEEDVTTLAMTWKNTLIAKGCEPFFDRGEKAVWNSRGESLAVYLYQKDYSVQR